MNEITFYQYVQQIISVDAQYNKKPNLPAEEIDIMRLKASAWSLNEYSIPGSYETLLLAINGIDFNGHLLYGSYSPSLIETDKHYASMDFGLSNELWSDYGDNEHHDLIMFGESGLSLYVYNRVVNRFEVIDRVGGDSFFDSTSFDGLLDEVLPNIRTVVIM